VRLKFDGEPMYQLWPHTIHFNFWWKECMYVSLNRLPSLKPVPALIKRAVGYFSLVVGAAFLVKGLQLLSIFDPRAEETYTDPPSQM
jgi:hypothetical protein